MEKGHEERLFPIFLTLASKRCVVVGGGEVAARKVRALLDSGARVFVIAPQLCAALDPLAQSGQVEHVARSYETGDLEGSALAFGATDDRSVNEGVYTEATRLGVPVNVVDQPHLCSFYVPATLARGPITVAISTQGMSPALARRLRERLEEAVPPEYGDLAALLGSLRAEMKAAFPSGRERGAKWRRVLDGEVLSLLRSGKPEEALAATRKLLGLDASGEHPCPAVVRIGSRGSALALAQARAVAERLEQMGAEADIVTIRTSGDRGARTEAGSTVGVFVREIEQALLRGEVDLAVHSMKDLPTGPRDGLVSAAVPPREDPRDAIITRTGQGLDELPPASRVATSSPRRVAQLRSHRPDLVFVPVRGNVDTRLRKLERGDFEALILACAGLARLGLQEIITERLPVDVCLPAPGQGALALQVREQDAELRALLAPLDHAPSRLAVETERAFLAGVGSGCTVPAGALALVEADRLVLKAVLEGGEGELLRDQIEGPRASAAELGLELALRMRAAAPNRTAMDQP
jgi:hydroxymethylbilane synthase